MKFASLVSVIPLVKATVGGIFLDEGSVNICNVAPEIVLVQDITYSYEDAMRNMGVSMPQVFRMLHDTYPGTKFGIVSFKDDPGCAGATDYCARLEQSLQDPGAVSMKKTQEVFENLYPSGGGDPSENFFGAVIRTLLSPQVGWSPKERTHDSKGRQIVRILIATTDCPGHLPEQKAKCWKKHSEWGDLVPLPRPAYEPFPKDRDGSWLAKDLNARCGLDAYEYPDPAYMFELLEEKDVVPIFLFGRGSALGTRHLKNETFKYEDYYTFTRKNHYSDKTYKQFFDPHFALGFRDLMIQYFKDKFNQTPIVEAIDDRMMDFPELLQKTLANVTHTTCGKTSTSTRRPTTTSTRLATTTTAKATTTTTTTSPGTTKTRARRTTTSKATTTTTTTSPGTTKTTARVTTTSKTRLTTSIHYPIADTTTEATDCTSTEVTDCTSTDMPCFECTAQTTAEKCCPCDCKKQRKYQEEVLRLVGGSFRALPSRLRAGQ